MPLHSVPESELREHCRRAIEGLELWLRRLINDKLSAAFGPNYVDATRADGSRLVRAELVRTMTERTSKEPKRFSRPIDAALLDEEISIICNPALYKSYFKDALSSVFPQGHESARNFLQRLVPIRNALYHANPLSVHDAYRVLCYSMDVIEGLKSYYARINMSQLYNVPTVIRICDSLGHVVHLSTSNRTPDGYAIIDYSNDVSAYLQCGDTLSIEVDVDPTFDSHDYEIKWQIANIGGPMTTGGKFHLLLTDRYVSTRFCVVCHVISKKAWHKLGSFDDQLDIAYKVLPPP
jgi:hypothetical protein